MSKNDESSKSRGPSAFKLVLVVIILVLVPTTMEQLSMHPDEVKLVGRVCVGIGLLIFAYGLISKALRFGGVLILILIVARLLANEGVIQVPKLLSRQEPAAEKEK